MKIPIQHPRLTSSLRESFDADDAFLRRKSIILLQAKRSSSSCVSDSELARKIINNWDKASPTLRLAYKQFVDSVTELINGEMPPELFREVAFYAYRLFGGSDDVEEMTNAKFSMKRSELQSLVGHVISENAVRKVASEARKLYNVLPGEKLSALDTEDESSSSCDEFGSDFSFQEPARFLIDSSNWNEDVPGSGTLISLNSSHNSYTRIDRDLDQTMLKSDTYDLIWIRNACETIVQESATQLSRDDVAMAICRLLDSEKPGEEIAGDLFDLLGDSAFSVVQDLLGHRKEFVDSFRNALSTLKSVNVGSNGQPRVPSYGTQVTVQLESGKLMDKLRRKEEKRHKRSVEFGFEADPSDISFSSLIGASAKKASMEDHIGYGLGSHTMQVTALPYGTTRKHFKGYEEVIVPPTPTAQMKPGEHLIEIKELDDFAQTAFLGYKSLNRIQSQIFEAVYHTNENILVCAPTGAGKTNIAMISILHEIGQHFKDGYLHKNEFKIVYVAPMKALAAEVTSTFSHRLSPLNMNVRELTGDMQLSKNELEDTQMIVTTPEKWDVITRKSSDMSLSMLVKLLIIDEVHLLNDDRGPVIEALVARTLRQVESTQTMIRIVGLSATLPNYMEVAQFLRVNPETGLFFFDSSYRPVPLAQQYIGISEQNFLARMELLNEICYKKVVDSVRQGHQAMVFVHSRKDTAKTAAKLVELARKYSDLSIFDNSDHPQHSLLKKEVVKSRNKDLVELFEFGVGLHHAGMLRADRSLTEKLFSAGVLKILVCTATLAWGVNLPAHTVVIKGTQLYDPKAGGWKDLGMLDVMQIFGRAGRPQFDKNGEGIIITSHDKLAYYLRLLTSQLPIESQFISSLKDNLNAEVALGTVTNVKEACAWLGYTYLIIRMRQNPLAYGISWEEVIADPSLVLKQRNLVIDAARALDIAKMMRFDEKSGNFYCTELGRIASHFYIQYSSVETYNEMLRRHMSDSEIIDMVAHSSEFENITVREEEQNELESLLRTSCPLEAKGGSSNKHGKISILIQLYISRGFINTFSLVSDAAYISASLARIMRALFEICLRRGWAEMSLFLLEYCKAVDRQIWPHQHPLRQFDKELSAEILSKLEERRADMDRLLEMEEKDIGAFIRHAHGGKLVKQHLGYFPWLQLSATVSPITRTVLKVDLLITPEFIWKERFHGAALRWWILVEDSENDHIYHSELFTLTKRNATGEPQKLSFNVPIFEPHPTQYYIHAVSDSWLQAEALYTISFHNLALPQGRTTHTELLDLKPLPVSSLCNGAYEALYKFSHFNPIQTQIFHALYHTDNNVLLGAPTGSGKTISAELAILRLFNSQPDMKVVYIAPLKAIVRERMKDWEKHLVLQLGKKMVEMTGDYTPDLKALLEADVIISTPEKWDGISRNWHSRSYVTKVGLLILDEIHLLGADRGPILEVIVSRMRYITSQTKRPVRFVGLSTALANASDLADWLGVDEIGLFNFKPSVRPVPLEVHIQGYPGKYYCPRMNSMNKPAYAAINTHSPTKPVIIFVSSRRQTRLTALDLIQFAASDEHPVQFLSMSEENLQMVLLQVTDQNLRHTLQFGIGLHHAGLNDKDRGLVEELFAHNKIQILVCTSTLAWGVNLPAHLVIIKGTEYYDGKTKRYVDFPITDILQMMGRAGRPQYDQHGKAVILVHEPKKSFYKKFLYEPFPVESSLKDQLHDHFNAEIVAGTICDKNDALHYLTWTYFFRRLMVNPSYYALENAETETVNSYLSRLVQWTFDDLEDSRCIKIVDNRVEPTILGILASQYYLSYVTLAMFGSNIGPETSLNLLLRILSDAVEYDELPVRHNEENYNEALSAQVRYPVDKNRYDNPHTKANLLFQAHFSQLELPISDYITDLKSVLDQSIRIIQAMIDICANSGWLCTSITCMHVMQMIIQGLWFDKDSALWMVPCMNAELEGVLIKRGINTVQQLLDLSRAELLSIVRKDHSAKLLQELLLFPRIQMKVKLGQKIVDDKHIGIVNIKLKKLNSNQNTLRAFAPRFPKVKDEAWWLVLGNTLTSELHGLRRVSFIDELNTHMELPSISEGTKVFLISDTYLGFQHECALDTLAQSHKDWKVRC